MQTKFQVFFSHAFFVAFCAVGLCTQTYILLDLPINKLVLLFVFVATICSYNFYWLVSKFYNNTSVSYLHFAKSNRSHVTLFFAAGILVLMLSFLLPGYWLAIALSSLFTLLYSLPRWPYAFAKSLRRIGIIKTLLLAFTWTFVTVVIPAATIAGKNFGLLVLLFIVRFLFMFLLCILFDARDAEADLQRDMHTVATDVEKEFVSLVFKTVYIGFIASILVLVFIFQKFAHAIPFSFTAALLYGVYLRSKTHQGYFFYYFIIDGLMLVLSLGSILVTFL